jgi:hypothetical protein
MRANQPTARPAHASASSAEQPSPLSSVDPPTLSSQERALLRVASPKTTHYSALTRCQSPNLCGKRRSRAGQIFAGLERDVGVLFQYGLSLAVQRNLKNHKSVMGVIRPGGAKFPIIGDIGYPLSAELTDGSDMAECAMPIRPSITASATYAKVIGAARTRDRRAHRISLQFSTSKGTRGGANSYCR